MVDSGKTITRKTFCANVDRISRLDVEKSLGYPAGKLTIANDYAVSFNSGKLHRNQVYWINHSLIEYVFT